MSLLGRVNFSPYRDCIRKEFFEILDKFEGLKAIVWDDVLTSTFRHITDYKLLKEHGVEKIFKLSTGQLLQPGDNIPTIIYITRPHLHLMDKISADVHKLSKSKDKREIVLMFTPRRSLICENKLKERGVYGSFSSLEEYCVDLLPIDNDLLSMEISTGFKDLHIDNDCGMLYQVAKSLVSLQNLYGPCVRVCGKGHSAQQVCDLLRRLTAEQGLPAPHSSQIHTLVLLDRATDLISPLTTQLTYEGLIDEFFGISNNIAKFPSDKFPKDSSGDRGLSTRDVLLSSNEDLYCNIRDKNFSAVGPVLSRKAKQIVAQFEERHGAETVGEIKKFVAKLPHIDAAKQSLAIHTSIAELIKEKTDQEDFLKSLQTEQEFLKNIDTDKVHPYIEECLATGKDPYRVLRLMCLQSVINGGLKTKAYEYYVREFLQVFGVGFVLVLCNLHKAGVLTVQGRQTYHILRRSLRLTVDEVNEKQPNDIAYVHSGYAPLSVRLVQQLLNGSKSLEDCWSVLPGPKFDEYPPLPIGFKKDPASDECPIALVFFIGGCTFAEIAALRFLSQLEDASSEFLIATTKLINGSTFLKSLKEEEL